MEILHLARRADWDRAQRAGRYRISTRGRTLEEVGFVHAALREQLTGVAEAFYADDADELCVLVMDDARIRASDVRVVFEDGGDGRLYPHIYGPIQPDWVVDVLPAHFDVDGRFVF
jgi:uncharacterized protein (DUF952 family)